jgi:hypothetical protein
LARHAGLDAGRQRRRAGGDRVCAAQLTPIPSARRAGTFLVHALLLDERSYRAIRANPFGLRDLYRGELPREPLRPIEIPEASRRPSFETMDEVLEIALAGPLPSMRLEEPETGPGIGERPADGSVTH